MVLANYVQLGLKQLTEVINTYIEVETQVGRPLLSPCFSAYFGRTLSCTARKMNSGNGTRSVAWTRSIPNE
jgi:hypothetical protein